jgi:4-amino-4-deoxy-L-arabinose transferase-like glycosyltransferase
LVLPIGSIGLAQIASHAFAAAALAITFFATRSITASTLSGLAALVVAAANVHLWWWSGTVLETSLGYLAVTIIAAFTLWLMDQRRTGVWDLALLGALIGLGTQVRFEIGIFLPLSMVALWFSWPTRRRQIPAVIGGFVVAVLPWLTFATAYFGTPIPTTFSAKADSFHLVHLTTLSTFCPQQPGHQQRQAGDIRHVASERSECGSQSTNQPGGTTRQ